MEIALVRRRYSLSGGAENYTNRLATGLAQNGMNVTILCEQWPQFDERINIRTLPPCRSPVQFAREVQSLTAVRRFDFIFSLERIFDCDIYRAGDGVHQAWLDQRARTMGWHHRFSDWLNPKHHQILALEKNLFHPKHVRALAANSFQVAREIMEYYNYPEDRIHVIYNGVDTEKFAQGNPEGIRSKYHIAEDDFLILLVGSGCKRKGFVPSIQALEFLPANVKLMILGKDIHRIPAALSRSYLASKRLFVCKPTDKPEDYYAACDLFLLPTVYEPFSNACLEALSAGKPVITTLINGFSEILTSEIGVKLKKPNSPPEIASAVQSLLDKTQLARIKPLAQEKAGDFSISRNINETLKLIKQTARMR